MWTNKQIENAKIRAELCKSVTLTRDSYLELLETATYEQASRARVTKLEAAVEVWTNNHSHHDCAACDSFHDALQP